MTLIDREDTPVSEAPVAAPRDDLRRDIERLQREIYELARRVGAGRPAAPLTGTCEFLVCRLEGGRVGLPLAAVEEVVPLPWLAPIPEAPPWVPGLLTLRGESLPVLDVAARVNRRRREASLTDLIVVANLESRRVGLVVQAVHEIARFDAAEIRQPPEELPHGPYLLGLIQAGPNPVLLLDVAALVAQSDVVVGQEVEA